jgi:hypothetical protein
VNEGVMQVEQDSLVGTRHCEAAYPQRGHASATRSERVNHRFLRGYDVHEGPPVVDVGFPSETTSERVPALASSHREESRMDGCESA